MDGAERQRVEAQEIRRAAEALRQGALVAFPTETVYGLGADATNPQAVARLFEAKGRPRFNPLIIHLAEAAQAPQHGLLDDAAHRLAATFWPGALTLVVPFLARSPICALARAGLDTVALRVPAHPVAHDLIAATGRPIAAPSANRSGRVSPTRAEHVAADLGDRVSIILDAGPTPIGLESTIVACLGDAPRLLRPGGVTQEAIEAALGRPLAHDGPDAGRPAAPGRLASHYAPNAVLRLEATGIRPGEALLAFGPALPPGAEAAQVFNLSERSDLVEAAARFYEGLRALDASGAGVIAVMPIPRRGLGLALNDRLARAAAPRA